MNTNGGPGPVCLRCHPPVRPPRLPVPHYCKRCAATTIFYYPSRVPGRTGHWNRCPICAGPLRTKALDGEALCRAVKVQTLPNTEPEAVWSLTPAAQLRVARRLVGTLDPWERATLWQTVQKHPAPWETALRTALWTIFGNV